MRCRAVLGSVCRACSFLPNYTLQCLSLIVSCETVYQHNYNETIKAFEKCSRKMLVIVLFWWGLNSEPYTSNWFTFSIGYTRSHLKSAF